MCDENNQEDLFSLAWFKTINQRADGSPDILILLSRNSGYTDAHLGILWWGLNIGREIGSTDEGVSVILALSGVSWLIASNRIEEGRGRISIVGLAAVAEQCKVDEDESDEGGGPWPIPEPA